MLKTKLDIRLKVGASVKQSNIFWNNVVNFKDVTSVGDSTDEPKSAEAFNGRIIVVTFDFDTTKKVAMRFDQVRNFAHSLGILKT